MSKNIKYIAFYDLLDSKENRNVSISALNKVDYIIKALNELNYYVNVVSPAWATGKKNVRYKKIDENINNQTKLTKFFTINFKKKYLNIIKYLIAYFQLFKHLFTQTTKGDVIIVYHSNLLFIPIFLIKKIKKIKICLEIEEIYLDIQKNNKLLNFFEINLIKIADSYILSTPELKNKFDIKDKNHIVIEGSYVPNFEIEHNITELDSEFNDGRIHLVYAGTFDFSKKGAEYAIHAASKLSEKYHLHIIGFGNSDEIFYIKELILKINKISKCKISYDGLLTGVAYSNFLLKCDIGLSTQEMTGQYNNSSFPSKIISYLSHDLEVVSCKINSVTNSRVSKRIHFYDENDPKVIANTIKQVSKKSSAQQFMNEVHEEIKKDLKVILND